MRTPVAPKGVEQGCRSQLDGICPVRTPVASSGVAQGGRSQLDANGPVSPPFAPGTAALCEGRVFHRRALPTPHEFTYPVSYVWLDPDRPDDLCAAHPLWSSRGPAPARFRRRDYALDTAGSLAEAARSDLEAVLGRRPAGPVRMLTQVRRWGWLFNPITIYVVWDAECDDQPEAAEPTPPTSKRPAFATPGPVGAVLEVTNTPRKERIRYPIALVCDDGWWRAQTDKVLHVSPFLDTGHRYEVRIRGDARTVDLDIDVVPDGAEIPVLRTGLRVGRTPPTRRAMGAALRRLSTHRVSFGIHWEALRLWCKRVPFVRHLAKRSPMPSSRGSGAA